MRLAFFLDNRGIAGHGSLPDPRFGNPGIGGTEYAFLAVVRLLQGTPLQMLLLLTAPQRIEGIDPASIELVQGLAEAIEAAKGCLGLVFRPGFAAPADWLALEHSPVPLLPWLHNLGCEQQGRYEGLAAVQRWLLVSGAQLDAFRHSRLARCAVVLPNPVAVPPAQRSPRSLELATAAMDVAYVGALTPFKGFDRLARQWPAIARACPEARLQVFGGADLYGKPATSGALTPYERHCRQLLERGGFVDRVIFEGSCGLERYGALEHVAIGVVNPSGCDETFCLAAAEFSACGIPVLAPRRNALIHTVQDQRTGVLVDSEQQLAAEAIALLQNPTRAWVLGTEGQRYVQQAFGTEAVQGAWLQLAQELAEGDAPQLVPVSTPWWHEQRWLRQLWGQGLVLQGWPSWPVLKALLKRLLQGRGQLGPRGIGLLAGLVALLIWGLLVLGKFDGNPSGLVRVGDQLPLSNRVANQPLRVLHGKRGNDGQQFLTLALDPFQVDPSTSAALDNPIYRGKRLLYPLVAWVAGLGQASLILWVLGLINVATLGWAAGWMACWAQLQQRSPWWGLAVLSLPGAWITLTLSTADLLSTSLLIGAAVSVQQRRLSRLVFCLAAAALCRETSLLAWAATVLFALLERRWRWLLPLAIVPVPFLVWMGLLQHRFAHVPDAALAGLHFSWPLVGVISKATELLGLTSQNEFPFGSLERFFDGFSFLFWLSTLLLLVISVWQGWGGRWLRLVAACYLLPALCTSMQILARFPDYGRVWIDLSSLALLSLLAVRTRFLLPWMVGAGALSIGYGVGFFTLTS